MSKSQIDRLGDRLRDGRITEEDLRLLDDYRRSFIDVYELVFRRIAEEVLLKPTGRPAKSTTALIAKLNRETARLSQVQDIAGCRLVVEDIAAQEVVVGRLKDLFHDCAVIDRRTQPSHGYRAVHVVVRVEGKPIEVQVRTEIQHQWAELSEKFSDVEDPAIKYGGGNEVILELLAELSELVAQIERLELEPPNLDSVSALQSVLLKVQMQDNKKRVAELLERTKADLDKWR